MTNSTRKGKRIEREAAKFLTSLGFPARRGQQHRGGPDAPDVVGSAPGPLDRIHIEVKGDQRIDIGTADWGAAIEQCRGECGGKPWILLWRRRGTTWRATWEVKEGVLGGIHPTVTQGGIPWLLHHLTRGSSTLPSATG